MAAAEVAALSDARVAEVEAGTRRRSPARSPGQRSSRRHSPPRAPGGGLRRWVEARAVCRAELEAEQGWLRRKPTPAAAPGPPGWARAALASAPKQPAAAGGPVRRAASGGGGAAVDSPSGSGSRGGGEEGARALTLIQASIAKAERARRAEAGVDAVRRGEGPPPRRRRRRRPPGSTISARRAVSWPTTFRTCGGGAARRARARRSRRLRLTRRKRRCRTGGGDAPRADARLDMLSAQGALEQREAALGSDRHKRRAAQARLDLRISRRGDVDHDRGHFCRRRLARRRLRPIRSLARRRSHQPASRAVRGVCGVLRCDGDGVAGGGASPRATPRRRRSRRQPAPPAAAAARRAAAAGQAGVRARGADGAAAPEVVVEAAGTAPQTPNSETFRSSVPGLKASSATRMSTPRSASSGWSSAAESPRGDEEQGRRRSSGWRR